MMSFNQEQWNKMHENRRYRPFYPHEAVVQWVFRNFGADGNSKILDDGCGAGRHVLFLASEKIIPYGIDFSKSGVNYTRSLLADKGYSYFCKNIVVGGVDKLPFGDNEFDGVLSFGVLYYLNTERIKKSVSEIYRVLKPGGKCLVTVRSTEDYRFITGEPTPEHNTVIVRETNSGRNGSSENGMSMHFFSKEEFTGLFKNFTNVSICEYIIAHNDGE